MNRYLRLVLDILLGVAVPILLLSRVSGPLGFVPSYLVSPVVPVGRMAVRTMSAEVRRGRRYPIRRR